MTALSRLPARLPLKTCVADIYRSSRKANEHLMKFSFRYNQSENLIRRVYDTALENLRYKCGNKDASTFIVEAYTESRPNGFRIVIHQSDYIRYMRGER